jgi:hypothetical protein
MTPTTSYDGDEPMYPSDYDNNNYDGDRGSGEDGCADLGCLFFFVLIVYALYKCCCN